MKKLGIDFDNTIVIYDELFYKVALERNLIPINFSKNKLKIMNLQIYRVKFMVKELLMLMLLQIYLKH